MLVSMPPRTIAPPNTALSLSLPPLTALVAAPPAITKQRLNIALCIVLNALICPQEFLALLSIPTSAPCLSYPLVDIWQPNASGNEYWYALPGSTPCCCGQNGALPQNAPLHSSPQENPTPPAKTVTVGHARKPKPIPAATRDSPPSNGALDPLAVVSIRSQVRLSARSA
jgi:hypothetical protein